MLSHSLDRLGALRRAVLFVALLALGSALWSPVHADPLNVTFTLFSQTGNPGDTLYYDATFTNTTSNVLTVSNASFFGFPAAFDASFSYGLFRPDFDATTALFSVGANSSLDVSRVVALVLDTSLPPNTYSGQVNFNYRAFGDPTDSTTGDNTITANVTPAATPVPEPAYVQMGVLLALGSLGWRRTRRRSA